MKYLFFTFILAAVVCLSVLISCSKTADRAPDRNPEGSPPGETTKAPNLPLVPFNYVDLNLPSFYTVPYGGVVRHTINGMDNTPLDNPVTNDGATLGRVLFYEKALSLNRSISCGSCHHQELGFSDTATTSAGFAGGHTRRNSMTLINSLWYQRGHFFSDERAATLEVQTTMPILDPVEMGLSEDTVVQRIRGLVYYPALFTKAFGDANVTLARVSKALAQFVRSIVSTKSKYDVARAAVVSPSSNFPSFTSKENEGKHIFFKTAADGGGCFTCHISDAFVSENVGPQNIGLDSINTTDFGVFETFPNEALMEWRFKQTTLKNVALTAPYMHDGRFKTLEEVIDHYSTGVKNSPTLSAVLRGPDGLPRKLNFTPEQKAALVAFLNTFTDNTIATEPKWSDPFK